MLGMYVRVGSIVYVSVYMLIIIYVCSIISCIYLCISICIGILEKDRVVSSYSVYIHISN